MSAKNKLQRFAELETLTNVYQARAGEQYPHIWDDFYLTGIGEERVELKGQWGSKHFKNDNPIVLELACGKGEYTRHLAAAYPGKNFIGVDIKGNRIWRGAVEALRNEQENVAFLRTQIEHLTNYFAKGEVSEIWITFPDPFLRLSKAQKRLTSSRFLAIYRQVMNEGSIVHLKTDDPTLYEFTLETLAEEKITPLYTDFDIYSKPLPYPELEWKTYYEGLHLADGRKIKYTRFSL